MALTPDEVIKKSVTLTDPEKEILKKLETAIDKRIEEMTIDNCYKSPIKIEINITSLKWNNSADEKINLRVQNEIKATYEDVGWTVKFVMTETGRLIMTLSHGK